MTYLAIFVLAVFAAAGTAAVLWAYSQPSEPEGDKLGGYHSPLTDVRTK